MMSIFILQGILETLFPRYQWSTSTNDYIKAEDLRPEVKEAQQKHLEDVGSLVSSYKLNSDVNYGTGSNSWNWTHSYFYYTPGFTSPTVMWDGCWNFSATNQDVSYQPFCAGFLATKENDQLIEISDIPEDQLRQFVTHGFNTDDGYMLRINLKSINIKYYIEMNDTAKKDFQKELSRYLNTSLYLYIWCHQLINDTTLARREINRKLEELSKGDVDLDLNLSFSKEMIANKLDYLQFLFKPTNTLDFNLFYAENKHGSMGSKLMNISSLISFHPELSAKDITEKFNIQEITSHQDTGSGWNNLTSFAKKIFRVYGPDGLREMLCDKASFMLLNTTQDLKKMFTDEKLFQLAWISVVSNKDVSKDGSGFNDLNRILSRLETSMTGHKNDRQWLANQLIICIKNSKKQLRKLALTSRISNIILFLTTILTRLAPYDENFIDLFKGNFDILNFIVSKNILWEDSKESYLLENITKELTNKFTVYKDINRIFCYTVDLVPEAYDEIQGQDGSNENELLSYLSHFNKDSVVRTQEFIETYRSAILKLSETNDFRELVVRRIEDSRNYRLFNILINGYDDSEESLNWAIKVINNVYNADSYTAEVNNIQNNLSKTFYQILLYSKSFYKSLIRKISTEFLIQYNVILPPFSWLTIGSGYYKYMVTYTCNKIKEDGLEKFKTEIYKSYGMDPSVLLNFFNSMQYLSMFKAEGALNYVCSTADFDDLLSFTELNLELAGLSIDGQYGIDNIGV